MIGARPVATKRGPKLLGPRHMYGCEGDLSPWLASVEVQEGERTSDRFHGPFKS